MQLNLHRLWIFMQVVECGGFSTAAQKLYLSQPSVSNHVRQLESSLHATLIDRSGARIKPTAEGEVLLEYAKRVFLLADEAVAAIGRVAGLAEGSLVVGGTTTVGSYLLPPLVARFRRSYPGIECDIHVGNEAQITSQLLAGEIGMAVIAGRPGAPQLMTEEILEDRLVLVADPGHRLAGAAASAGDLAGERFLMREQGSSTRKLQEDALGDWGLESVARSEMWAPETLKQAVAAGLGIALVSEHAVRDELRNGQLAAVTVDKPAPSRPIMLTQRRDRLLAPAETAFVRLLRSLSDWPN